MEAGRVASWQREGKYPASIEKSMETIDQLDAEILQLRGHVQQQEQYAAHQPFPNLSLGPRPESPQEAVPQHPSFSTPDDAGKGLKWDSRQRARKVPRIKQSFGLLVTFGDLESPATGMSCADTGSSVTAISTDLAIDLGLTIELDDEDEPLKIQVGSGRWISSYGKIVTSCTMGSALSGPSTIGTVIHVFERLTRPGLFFWSRLYTRG